MSGINLAWEQNEFGLSIRNSTSLNIFKGRLLQFVKPLENSAHTCHNAIGILYLKRLRLAFSHVCYHKFKYGFLDAIDHFVAAAQQLKMLFITSFTVPTFQVRKIFLSMKAQLLAAELLTKTKSKLFKHSFMLIQIIS